MLSILFTGFEKLRNLTKLESCDVDIVSLLALPPELQDKGIQIIFTFLRYVKIQSVTSCTVLSSKLSTEDIGLYSHTVVMCKYYIIRI